MQNLDSSTLDLILTWIGDHLAIVPLTTTTAVIYATHLADRQSILRDFHTWLDVLASQARDRAEQAELASLLTGIDDQGYSSDSS